MKILLDTNILLDGMLERQPFASMAAQLMGRVELGTIQACLAATTLTTFHYLARKAIGHEEALKQINKLLRLFEISPVNRLVLEDALTGKGLDFEDNVLMACAVHSGCDAIVTRDARGFKYSKLRIYSASDFIKTF
jgi:predicted nucleic acid-binding protein